MPYGEERLREAAKHGFKRAIVPEANAPRARRSRDRRSIGVERARRHALRQRLLSAAVGGVAAGRRGCTRTVLTRCRRVCRISIAVVADRSARAGFGNRLELLDDQAVQRLRPVGRQLPAHRAVQRAHVGAAFTTKLPSGSRCTSLCSVAVSRRELADDLLEDVLERDESLHVAVFVDDERERRRCRWKLSSCMLSGVPSGTKYGSRAAREPAAARGRARRAPAVCATFFMCRMPMSVVEVALVDRQARMPAVAQLRRGCRPSRR